jgi:hypothetical protein
MDELEFETALETFLTNVGIEIEGDIEMKLKVVQANGELGIEFAQYLFRALKVLEDEMKTAERQASLLGTFLDRHLRTPGESTG